jgi:Dolichyl-phosphate-mannose-protein mannosyltransferase
MKGRPTAVVLGVILLLALVVRTRRLDHPLFVVDEAESTINAFTILQHGVPTNHYLGLPIFENTLVQPWPESVEYEFRDSSYSRRGLATYHGWLPLYSIAASLRLFGIEPHDPPGELRVRRSDDEIRRLTVAARAPSVLFGMVFLVLLFTMTDELAGREAAWVALVLGAFSDAAIDYSRQARYYSLTALLTAACCYMAWRLRTSERWRDFVSAGLLLGLLFHTHAVASLAAGLVFGCVAIARIQRPGMLARWLGSAAVTAALILPWLAFSGFLEQSRDIPRAFPLLRFPDDVLSLIRIRTARAVVVAIAVLAFATAWLGRRVLRARIVEPFARRREAIVVLAAYIGLTYLIFTVLMPTVSYSVERLALMLCGPALVLIGLLMTALAQALVPAIPQLATAGLLVVYLFAFGTFDPLRFEGARPPSREEVISLFRRLELEPQARLYATPNFQFILAAYTSLPFQSIAPVRRSFLESYPGQVVLVEVNPYRSMPARIVQRAAAAAGVEMTIDRAQRLAWRIAGEAARERAARLYPSVEQTGDPDPLPELARPLVADVPRYTDAWLNSKGSPAWDFPAVFRGYTVHDWSSWWPVFFYRYVHPEERMGEKANYRLRFRSARAFVLPSGVGVYIAPATSSLATSAVPPAVSDGRGT